MLHHFWHDQHKFLTWRKEKPSICRFFLFINFNIQMDRSRFARLYITVVVQWCNTNDALNATQILIRFHYRDKCIHWDNPQSQAKQSQ